MATNRKDLKAFIRIDGSGRNVPSSLILRKSKPKIGKWVEVNTWECCNNSTTTTSTTMPKSSSSLFTIKEHTSA